MVQVNGRWLRAMQEEDGAGRLLIYYGDLKEALPFAIPNANNLWDLFEVRPDGNPLVRLRDHVEVARVLGLRRTSIFAYTDDLPGIFDVIYATTRLSAEIKQDVRTTMVRVNAWLRHEAPETFDKVQFEAARHLFIGADGDAPPSRAAVEREPTPTPAPASRVSDEDRPALTAIYKAAVATRAIANRYAGMAEDLERQLPPHAQDHAREAARTYFRDSDPFDPRPAA
ncbi:hypothetical protein [Methylobacterium ajmalii]|uniref:hypothetical protein n=1 Tax=Methylobacterium ajmalii TaxID=2738439 RepID=UPI002F352735